ncbi:MAG: cupredoxin domain-containing protein [Actinomycetota bacterium]|nr:cupredoxin domain-containing protein [Actinomycetota bacterium]
MSVTAVAAGALLLIGGCSSTPRKSTPAGASGAGTTVTAVETDFKIALSQTSLKPGTYTFKVSNHGKAPHNLTVDGPGVKDKASATVQGGESGKVTVTLQAGSYELYCSVDSHKDKGMDMTVKMA